MCIEGNVGCVGVVQRNPWSEFLCLCVNTLRSHLHSQVSHTVSVFNVKALVP